MWSRWVRIVAVVLALALVALAGGGSLWFFYTLRKRLPQSDGERSLAGLRQDVEIIRDRWGVPHIYARNEADLFFGFGYAMAEDRFWQMEFMRRLGQGRLAEIFGEGFVDADRYFRMLSAAGINRHVPSDLAFIPTSFADGVNAYLQTHKDALPFEFTLLRYRPEPWGAEDYLAILKVMNWSLSSAWTGDLLAAEILEKVGQERFQEAFPQWPADAPLVVPGARQAVATAGAWVRQVKDLVSGVWPMGPAAASNNWVISGSRTRSGRPILANDTHLGLSNPSMWWEVHLECPTITVSGFAIPWVPGIPIGHNGRVAWGVTNVMVDDVDFYVEKIHPDDPRRYRYKDRWETMRAVRETIRVKGKDPVTVDILVTRHGPLVSKPGEKALAARWTFPDGLQPVRAGYLLIKAGNIRQVKEALRYWELPSQNFVFADSDGHIGYWCCAAVPIRSRGNGLLPVQGWTGQDEWHGYVPFDERPHLIDPPEGFIATANGKMTGDDYPYPVSMYWEPSDRITRIRQLLQGRAKLGLKDVQQMHRDVYCPLAAELVPRLLTVLDKALGPEQAPALRALLKAWDYRMTKDSAAACLYEVTYRKLMDRLFKDELGQALHVRYLKTTSLPPRAIRRILRQGASAWADDVNTPQEEDLEDVLAVSLRDAVDELTRLQKGQPSEWQWGKIHTLTFEHVIGKRKPLDRLFNLGPFPVGGGHLTIKKSHYPYAKPYRANHGVSQRMVVDFSRAETALHVLPTGECGHLGSRHRKDQIRLYLAGEYHPAWTRREEVEANREGRLLLRPR